ncbi:hypothetical protein GCM10007362_20170 [Saccharibacillus endophyticus]|uniref:Uncharacterized protein n=1 Tax=Saccharibacillus endophyticus TaxID=2060666 RepID=A0ABQ1ZRL9_9BACL|nr:hypothetical protein GCM10007362_20170 [Saccharibacillus endophyticus]
MTKRYHSFAGGHQITIANYNILLKKSNVNLKFVAYDGRKRRQDG